MICKAAASLVPPKKDRAVALSIKCLAKQTLKKLCPYDAPGFFARQSRKELQIKIISQAVSDVLEAGLGKKLA